VAQARLLKDENGDHIPDDDAVTAFAIAGRTHQYFLDRFGRDSYNNGGRAIDIYLHRSRRSKEAEFHHKAQSDLITMGDGNNDFNSTLASDDILTHEIAHGYVRYLSTLRYGHSQAGAIIEHLCDAFAWLVRRPTQNAPDDWTIGTGFPKRAQAMRDLRDPAAATVAMRCAARADQMVQVGRPDDLYFNAGVLGRAFAQAIAGLGADNADTIGAVWYRVAERLPEDGTFVGFRDEAFQVAIAEFPQAEQPLRDAFAAVGL
jgi:bacillolysin/thermolysin